MHPYGLLSRGGFWYIIGFDDLRSDRRVFRVDRIDGAITKDEPKSFQRPEDFDLSKAVPTEQELLRDGDGATTTAIVLVDASLAPRVRGEFGQASVVKERSNGSIEIEIPCANMAAFRVWLFALVDRAEVLSPQEIRNQVRAWLQETASAKS